MGSRPAFSAVLLAAGRSTRMGRDKALLEVDGVPLWQRQRDVLGRAGATEVFLSVRPEQEWANHAAGFAARLHDDRPNAGPMAGITAALECTTRSHVVALAIDLPLMTEAWLTSLADEAKPGVGVVGRQENFFEPLAAIYPCEMMSSFRAALAGAQYALQPVLAKGVAAGFLRTKEIGPSEAAWFANWNFPAGRSTFSA